MKNVRMFSFYTILFLIHWSTNPVSSADHLVARVTGAMQSHKSEQWNVVQDKNAKSGWSVDVKKYIDDHLTYGTFAYYYARSNPKDELQVAFALPLCSLIESTKEFKDFYPKQIIDMIFPNQKGDCNFKPAKTPILATANVNKNPSVNPTRNFTTRFPKTRPYDMEVRILSYDQGRKSDGEDYFFKVEFKVEDPK